VTYNNYNIPGSWHQWEGTEYKERVWGGEYGGILCAHV
jgi:hypothetical protein